MNNNLLLILDYENMDIRELKITYTIIGSNSTSLCDPEIRCIIGRYRELTNQEFNYRKIEMTKDKPPKIMKKAPRNFKI